MESLSVWRPSPGFLHSMWVLRMGHFSRAVNEMSHEGAGSDLAFI